MEGPAIVREAIGGPVHAVFVCPANEVHLALKEGWERDGNFHIDLFHFSNCKIEWVCCFDPVKVYVYIQGR